MTSHIYILLQQHKDYMTLFLYIKKLMPSGFPGSAVHFILSPSSKQWDRPLLSEPRGQVFVRIPDSVLRYNRLKCITYKARLSIIYINPISLYHPGYTQTSLIYNLIFQLPPIIDYSFRRGGVRLITGQ